MTVTVLHIFHITTLVFAFLSFALAWMPGERNRSRAAACALGGAVAGVIGLAIRTVASGHLPIFGTIENTWTCATVFLGTAAYVAFRGRELRRFWPLLTPWAVLFLLWGLRFRFEPVPLTISEQSIFVDLHVGFAWAAFVSLVWAGTIALAALVSIRRHKPVPEDTERVIARMIMIGYVLLTIMIMAGSWYLFVLFGTFWRWEIVGVLALVCWIGYSIALHGWLIQGWRGVRLFVLVGIMLVPLVLMFWVWSVFPGTYHFFDIPLLTP